MTDDVRIVPIGEAPWTDAETVFATRGDPARCWCQYFKLTGGSWRGSTREECRDALREQSTERPGPGLLAYLGDEPVGWCAVEPRPVYGRLRRAKVPAASPDPIDDPTVWSVTCLVVRTGFRRRGVAGALVRAAIEHARDNGARVVEAYPVDPGARSTPPSAAELYHGTVSLFAAAGLEEVARPLNGRALMRREF